MLVKPFDEVIALANVESTCAQALENVDEIHEKNGRDDRI